MVAADLLAANARSTAALHTSTDTAIAATWQTTMVDLSPESAAAWQAQAVPLVEAAQQQAAAQTNAYLTATLSEQLGEQLDPLELDLSAVTGAGVRNGVSPGAVYHRPVATARTLEADGLPRSEALRRGQQRAQTLAATDLQLASTHTSRAVLEAAGARVWGYRRILSGSKVCGMCVVASTQRYHREDLMPIHPGCKCDVAPIVGDEDPGRVINQDLLDSAHQAVAERFGISNRAARGYNDVLLKVFNHGEYGPTLARAGDTVHTHQQIKRVSKAARLARKERLARAKTEALARLTEQRRAATIGQGRVSPAVLDRWGVTEEQFLTARATAGQIKADIRAVARKEADDLGGWLFDNDLAQLTRPARLKRKTDIVSGARRSVREQSGYDFLEQLDDAEVARVRKRMVDSDLYSPDLVAEQVRRKTNLDLSDDEAMQWVTDRWLQEDGLRSLASGRVPKYADANNLIPGDYALDGYEIESLFGVELDEAAGHVAQVQADYARQYADRVLGSPKHGPAPWEMAPDEFAAELEFVDDVLASTSIEPGATPGEAYQAARARIAELDPPELDVTGLTNPYELHEAIRLVAQTAGRETV